jgi:hypothetical protein
MSFFIGLLGFLLSRECAGLLTLLRFLPRMGLYDGKKECFGDCQNVWKEYLLLFLIFCLCFFLILNSEFIINFLVKVSMFLAFLYFFLVQ